MLAPLERSLRRIGRDVVRMPHSAGREDLRDCARQVHEQLETFAAEPDFEYADVVGHSMGGLVATHLLKKLDRGRRIRNVVTLGTPHRGTPLAALGVLLIGRSSHAIWQMLPGSEFVRDLAKAPVPRSSRLTSISADSDWVVPGTWSEAPSMERSEHRSIPSCSHIQLLVHSPAHALVGSLLERNRPELMARAA